MKKILLVAATASFVVAAAALHRSPAPVGNGVAAPRFEQSDEAALATVTHPLERAPDTAVESVVVRAADAETSEVRGVWAELVLSGRTDEVIGCLSRPNPRLRWGAAMLLSVERPEGTVPALVEALEKEGDADVRRAMVETLAGIEDDGAGEMLLRVWQDRDEVSATRRLALQGLACLGHSRVIDAWVRGLLETKDVGLVESGLARALIVRGPVDAQLHDAVLRISLHSAYEWCRLEAAEALTRATQ